MATRRSTGTATSPGDSPLGGFITLIGGMHRQMDFGLLAIGCATAFTPERNHVWWYAFRSSLGAR
ncbi:MAG: hypothetical protein IPK39_05530 [Sulfuritalea sp.]|nr:hypothetical protein [Sulfuritalea sp.]